MLGAKANGAITVASGPDQAAQIGKWSPEPTIILDFRLI